MRLLCRCAAAAFAAWAGHAVADPPPGEHLVGGPPDGWKMSYFYEVPGLDVREYLPRAQSLDDWQDMITVQSLRGGDPEDPAMFLDRIARRARSVCSATLTSRIEPDTGGSLPAATMALFCGLGGRADRGDLTVYRVLQGREALYVIQKTRRNQVSTGSGFPLSEAEIAAWRRQLEEFKACSAGRDDCTGGPGERGAP